MTAMLKSHITFEQEVSGNVPELVEYARLPRMLECTLSRLEGLIERAEQHPEVDEKVAGRIPVGHKTGKVASAYGDVGTDPTPEELSGKDYISEVKKWCYTAGPPISEDEEEDAYDGPNMPMGVPNSKGAGGNAFRTVGKIAVLGQRMDDDDQGKYPSVMSRAVLKKQSTAASLKLQKAVGINRLLTNLGSGSGNKTPRGRDTGGSPMPDSSAAAAVEDRQPSPQKGAAGAEEASAPAETVA